MKPIIEVDHITKEFRKGEYIEYGSLRESLSGLFRKSKRNSNNVFCALNDISFTIEKGEAVGIVGKNGAGKSTFLKILSRITPPTRGKVTMRGRSASLLEVGTGFHSELTGRENIFFNGSLMGLTKSEIKKNFDSIIDFSGVEEFIDTPIKRYSTGMHVRLAFAVAAHLEPDILMVDEVLAVGDMEFQKRCLKKMDEVAHDGKTVIFVSHQMEMIERLCSRGILLSSGAVKADGGIKEVVELYYKTNLSNEELQGFSAVRTPFSDFYFTKGKFLDAEKEPLDLIRAGRSCTLRLYYECPKDAGTFNFGVAVYDQRYTIVAQFFSGGLTNPQILADKEKGYFDLNIKELPLIPGKYTMDLDLTQNGVSKDWVTRGMMFEVSYDDFYGTGQLPSFGPLIRYGVT